MKSILVAALLLVTAQQALAETVTLGSPVIMCRQAIYTELVQGRLEDSDVDGAMLVAKEGGCLVVQAGTEITIIDISQRKVIGIEAPMLDTVLAGYIARPR